MKENYTVFKRGHGIPIIIKGEITTSKLDCGSDTELFITFPSIDQEYSIDIHPIYRSKELNNIKVLEEDYYF